MTDLMENSQVPTQDENTYQSWEVPDVRSNNHYPTAKELAEIREQAQREGQEAGYQAGMAQADQAIAQIKQQLIATIALLANPLAQVQQQLENEVLAMVSVVTQQLVRHELSLKPELLNDIVQHALDALPSKEQRVKIYMNPQDHAALQQHMPNQDERCQFQADKSLQAGDIKLTTEYSEVDASLSTRIANLLNQQEQV